MCLIQKDTDKYQYLKKKISKHPVYSFWRMRLASKQIIINKVRSAMTEEMGDSEKPSLNERHQGYSYKMQRVFKTC